MTDLAAKPEYQEAREMGKRLFLTYCMQCHGSDAGGSRGFPNLTDNDWLWGGSPGADRTSIANGRNGDAETRPANLNIGDDKIDQVALRHEPFGPQRRCIQGRRPARKCS